MDKLLCISVSYILVLKYHGTLLKSSIRYAEAVKQLIIHAKHGITGDCICWLFRCYTWSGGCWSVGPVPLPLHKVDAERFWNCPFLARQCSSSGTKQGSMYTLASTMYMYSAFLKLFCLLQNCAFSFKKQDVNSKGQSYKQRPYSVHLSCYENGLQ